jgi:hypothetical protein
MLSFDHERWNHLKGGYKILFDPLLACENLKINRTPQPLGKNCGRSCTTIGHVCDASYAAVPKLGNL